MNIDLDIHPNTSDRGHTMAKLSLTYSSFIRAFGEIKKIKIQTIERALFNVQTTNDSLCRGLEHATCNAAMIIAGLTSK